MGGQVTSGKGYGLGVQRRQSMQRKGRVIRPTRKPRRIAPVQKGTPMSSTRPARTITPMPGLRPPVRSAAPAPKPPGPQPLPFDPVYQAQVAGLQRNQGLAQADIQYQTGQIKQEYGFDDPSSPFSRANMLQRAYQQGQAATTGGMASRGQLYSGALQSELDHGRFGHEQDVDTARRSYAQALQALSQRGAQATADYQSGLGLAGAERIERAPRAEDPGEPLAPAAAAAKKATKPKPKAQKGKAMKPIRKPRRIKPIKPKKKGRRL